INDVIADQMRKPFYVPRKDELLNYKKELYYEKTIYYMRLFEYVRKHITDGDKNEADEICEEIQYLCMDGFSVEKFFGVFDRMHIELENAKQVKKVLDLVTDLGNNTRRWTNNGYTSSELLSMKRNKEGSSTLNGNG